MLIVSRIFGEINIEDDKILTFEKGIMGFENVHQYAVIFDSEKKSEKGIMWLQCIDDGSLAFPVMDPMLVDQSYNPIVEDEWLQSIGKFENPDDLYVLSILTVPTDIAQMTANLKAPIIINTTTRKGCQIIVNNEDYKVRCFVYDYFASLKAKEES